MNIKIKFRLVCYALFILLVLVLSIEANSQDRMLFNDPAQPVEKRIDDLISRLSLEEKTGLLLYNSPAIERLGIPEYNWWNECLHGVGRAGKATVFPQAIGLAATFDPGLIYRVASAIGDEARAKHNVAVKKGNRGQYAGLSFWTPNINIFRDPRWGRGQETYGEDPYLTSMMGSAFVKGLQGNDPFYLKVSACAKHYVVHSGPEATRHHFNALPDERDFYETYIPAFKALVDAGVESVMCAYNRTYDEPCCGSPNLLNDILRKEWGFKGHIVSDCWALDDFWLRHKVVETRTDAAALAAIAGVNLNCGYIYQYIPDAVKQGLIDESLVDEILRPNLRTRFKLGLFNPGETSPYSDISPDIVFSDEHRKLAYEAAVKSVVLLKNNGILPLNRDSLKTLFVAGPTAADITALYGNYNGFAPEMNTFLEGIIGAVDEGTVVEFNQGLIYNNDTSFQGFWQAARADAIILCLGITSLFEGEEGEAMYNPHGGDRSSIELPENQVKYVKMMREKYPQKPIILIITGGSALAFPGLVDITDAIIFAWYPGQEGGKAVADILFGNVNPSGRLPVTFYRSTSDLPGFDDYSMKGRTYRYFPGDVLYPFGFGLSYTTFEYQELSILDNHVKDPDSITFTLKIKNAGDRDGEEVVQLYTSMKNSSVSRPLKWLVGFKRVPVKAGEVSVVKIRISKKQLEYYDPVQKNFVFEAGEYIFSSGGSSGTPGVGVSTDIY